MQEVKDFFAGPTKQVFFSINGEEIEQPFEVGLNTMSLRPTDATNAKDCITVRLRNYIHVLHLSNYYYDAKMRECTVIPHAVFFELLDALSSVFQLPIELTDESTKKVKDHPECKIPHFIMALAKGQTFYNHFHFENAKFARFILKYQKVKLLDFNPELYAMYEGIIGEQADVSLMQAAKFILDNCDNPILQRFKKRFIKELSAVTPDGTFKKLPSTDTYSVEVTQLDEHRFKVDFVESSKRRISAFAESKRRRTVEGGRKSKKRRF
jgi:hypothetical protein